MRKKLFIGLGVFLGIVAVFAIFAAMQPTEFAVERSTTVAAPPEVVFNQVNDFHKWEAWNPWGKLDPQAKNTFEGPESGEGAKFSWVGNNEVGEGRMTIAESRPNEQIKIDLEFIKPMPGKSVTLFKFTPEGDQTKVTWNMSGRNNFIGKAVCMFMNMDKMVGGQFEKGLAAMKEIAEAETGGAAPADSKPEGGAEASAEPSAAPEHSAEPANP